MHIPIYLIILKVILYKAILILNLLWFLYIVKNLIYTICEPIYTLSPHIDRSFRKSLVHTYRIYSYFIIPVDGNILCRSVGESLTFYFINNDYTYQVLSQYLFLIFISTSYFKGCWRIKSDFESEAPTCVYESEAT